VLIFHQDTAAMIDDNSHSSCQENYTLLSTEALLRILAAAMVAQ
jgi:hypothetical protein